MLTKFLFCLSSCSTVFVRMDIETNSAAAAPVQKPAKMSFWRKWGPALVAIAGVLALNASLLGPSGEKIPELSNKHLQARKLMEERTAEVTAMAPSADYDISQGFGSRSLSEEEGGVMEYTRRRHRYLRYRRRR